ncbi:uncharacterized protein [Onthophagus taurus]|uniref:uncharacterized protein n=1 Tax=Onthophagus taurus TaxID=166361 RepID=UPI000C209112|nr:protein ANTAGONIST OF LIKE HETEROCHROMATIN PROTEIN 1-like [Onthophagus taurus]
MQSNEEQTLEMLSDEEFQSIFRMSRKTSIALQAELDVLSNIDNESTDKNLLFCLWYLGNNEPITSAPHIFDLNEDAEEVLMVYLDKLTSLGANYIKWPDEEEFEQIEVGFKRMYGFPGVVGVIGSLHIHIASQGNDSKYYNKEMKGDTIVLQVVTDNNLLLRDVFAGSPGGKDVETILKSSGLYQKLIDENEYLTRCNKHLLGGTLHPQMKTLLTPYKVLGELTERQCKFNYLHNSVMFNVEQTFRCMENRFLRLTTVDSLDPLLCSSVVSAICILHNFTRVRNDNCNIYM